MTDEKLRNSGLHMVTLRFEPSRAVARVASGTTISDAAEAAGLDLDRPCGGRGRCGKCAVLVRELVGGDGRPRRVLACQEKVTTDLVVNLAPAALPSDVSALTAGEADFAFAPPISKVFLSREFFKGEPGEGLWAAIHSELDARDARAGTDGPRRPSDPIPAPRPDLDLLRALGNAYRRARHDGLTVVRCASTVTGFEPGDTTRRMLGFAVDIGTTTVAGFLYDLTTGKRLGVASSLNRQAKFGGDVVSRIARVQKDGNPNALQAEAVKTVANLIRSACDEAGVRSEDIYLMTAVGNSTMHHLFLGINPTCLGNYPFWVTGREMLEVKASSVAGLPINPQARIITMPLIGGYVGADTTAVILATGLHRSREMRLAIDIGTNGEIVIGNSEGLWVCSTAAGPALEGAGISCGTRAVPGAIDDVEIRGDEVVVTTIGGKKAIGICGSGVISAVAEMLRSGVIQPNGRLVRVEDLASRPRLAERIVACAGGWTASGRPHRAFVLVPAEDSATGRPIVFRQDDVRAVQLAKGAIAAGIDLLSETTGVSPEDVREVLLAGAFGNYIDISDGQRIGLLPVFPRAGVRPVGNAAGVGAQMILLSGKHLTEAAGLGERVVPVELATRPSFQKVFAQSLNFPSAISGEGADRAGGEGLKP